MFPCLPLTSSSFMGKNRREKNISSALIQLHNAPNLVRKCPHLPHVFKHNTTKCLNYTVPEATILTVPPNCIFRH